MMESKALRIIHLETTDSTNREAFRLLGTSSPPEGTAIVAMHQYSGRGQGQASWESEPGKNLTFSVILRPVFLPPANQFLLNQAIALGVRDGIAELLTPKENVLVKWPNDIYWKDRKVSGTLIENQIMGNRLLVAVAGIGINVNQDQFSNDAPNALSIKTITGTEFELSKVFETVFSSISWWYRVLQNENHKQIRESYLNHLLGFGETRRFSHEEKEFSGEITGIDEYGRILIRESGGQLLNFDIKEVRFLF
ncbi:MAG: biotin--[acetyl-CoA-carboxylase] ligase [Bacteroides sp.]|jgi:BirA family biotin operon repressor/biotin-[acetyl-CoA-carboxylase] ligase|nr:biotin--[acetyl-CoA-carboxylase] ligase [Bacteroides sp.]